MQSINFINFTQEAADQLLASEDAEYGGFGSKVKYPSPHDLLFLLRYSARRESLPARQAAERALKFMYFGGIHDHFGGGFFSGPCDREWLAPVFEKRLADNAMLALAYTEAWQDGHMAMYRDAAEGALSFCLNELKGPDGLFYSARVEREGSEPGLCCSFTPDEVIEALGKEDGNHFCECYDITPEGNFRGRSIPNLLLNTRQFFVPEGYAKYRAVLAEKAKSRACAVLDRRAPLPANAMLLMALSRAARAFDSARCLSQARALESALSREILSLDKTSPEYAASLSFFGLGLLELYPVSFDPGYLEKAKDAGEKLAILIAENAEMLANAPVEALYDNELPSVFDAAAVLMSRLGAVIPNPVFTKASDCLCSVMLRRAGKYPAGFAFGLSAVMDREYGRRLILEVSGCPDPSEFLCSLGRQYHPETDLLFSGSGTADALSRLIPAVSGLEPGFYTARNGAFISLGALS